MVNFKRGMVIEYQGKLWKINKTYELKKYKYKYLHISGQVWQSVSDGNERYFGTSETDIPETGKLSPLCQLYLSVLTEDAVSLDIVSHPPSEKSVRISINVIDCDAEKVKQHNSIPTADVPEFDTKYTPISEIRIVEDAPSKIKGLTKPKLMAYVIRKYGEMGRDDILRKVAEFEGTPYVKTSNKGYFIPTGNGKSVVEQGILIELKREGNKIIYGLGPKGREFANEARKLLGEV